MDEASALLGVTLCLVAANSTPRDHCTPVPNIKGVAGTATCFARFSAISVVIPGLLKPVGSDLMAPVLSGTEGKTRAIPGS
jgi:hypothetical protein